MVLAAPSSEDEKSVNSMSTATTGCSQAQLRIATRCLAPGDAEDMDTGIISGYGYDPGHLDQYTDVLSPSLIDVSLRVIMCVAFLYTRGGSQGLVLSTNLMR